MRTNVFTLLALFSVMILCVTSQEANAQTKKDLQAAGFIAGNGRDVVLVPGPTIPFSDTYVGEAVTWPVKLKGQGPQLAPTRIFVGTAEINPTGSGTYLTPSPLGAGWVRTWWVPALLTPDVAPGFGRADLEPFVDETGNFVTQWLVPKNAAGQYVANYPFFVFTTADLRTKFLTSELYTQIKEKRSKVKAEDQPKEDKKDDDKKKDEPKEEGKPKTDGAPEEPKKD